MVPEASLKCPGMQAWGGVKRETGEVLAGSHKPQQPEVGVGVWAAGTPRLLSHRWGSQQCPDFESDPKRGLRSSLQ